MLAEQGRTEEILAFGLAEKDQAVVEAACDLLFPEPVPLLIHFLSLQRGIDAPLVFRYHVSKSNYLYAEPEIISLYRRRRSRLSLDYLEGFGLAYLRGTAAFLPRYISSELRTYAEAILDGNPEDKPARPIVESDGTDQWSGSSERTLAALLAIRRLDHDIDPQMLNTLRVAAGRVAHKHLSLLATAIVEWASFDSGAAPDPEPVKELILAGATEVAPDFATTLLKQDDYSGLKQFASGIADVHLVASGFCFWPLVNYLESEGLLDVATYGHHPAQPLHGYVRARSIGLAPPPWYEWREAA